MISMLVCKRDCVVCFVRAVLDSPLTIDNYSSKFHTLLFLEEIQQEFDMQTYDMDEAKLTRYRQNKQLLALSVRSRFDNLQLTIAVILVGLSLFSLSFANYRWGQ